MSKYVIHTCKQREWYVKDYLVPSMMRQGIDATAITIYLDQEQKGNLTACMQCFNSMPDDDQGTWHLQDDVLIASDFKQKTEELENKAPIVCGFCFNTPVLIPPQGMQFASQMWYSFQCIKIDNKIARECAEWFFKQKTNGSRYDQYIRANKYDDTLFQTFIKERFPTEKIAFNCKPTLVEHIDDLIGGSIINQDRNIGLPARGLYFPQPGLIDKLRIQLNNRNKKIVVYAGTRNLYNKMLPAIRSLLLNTHVDKVYLLIEDNEFPYPLPPEVQIMNVVNQRYIEKISPNLNNKWGYMVLLRAAYADIFWQYDKILSLDVDTIVVDDISGLWDIDLEDNYLAAVKQPEHSQGGKDMWLPLYVNLGVAMYNLKKLRDGTSGKLCKRLNYQYYTLSQQDCFNRALQEKIKELPPEYNNTKYFKQFNITTPTENPKIIHYAAIENWWEYPEYKKYAAMKITDGQKEY